MKESFHEFDLHGHTKYSAFPSSINYSPEEAVIKAKEVGLHGIAITGHDTVEGLDEGLDAAAKHGVIVIPGIEITSRIGSKTPHIVALGITPDDICRSNCKIPRYKGPEEVISWIHDLGGLAIAVHPSRTWHRMSLNYAQIREYQTILDGIEVVTTHGRNKQLETMAKEFNVAEVGCSDFHSLDEIGLVVTRVWGKVSNYEDVLQAIKGKGVGAFSHVTLNV